MKGPKTTFFEKGAEKALEKDRLGDYCLDCAVYALESAADIRGEELEQDDQNIEDAAERYMEKIREGETELGMDEDMLEDITLVKSDRMIYFPNFEDLNYSAQLYCVAFLDRKE